GAQSTRSAKERSAMICQSATIRWSHSRSSGWRLVCSRTRSFIEGMRPVSPIVREDLAMSEMWDWLHARATEREAAGLRRRLWTREAGHALVDLAGNDYLGLSGHPQVREAA